ncbi:hypothetical protein BH20ACT23_BH20ACT23_10260 [soil metagenome]
MCDLYPELDPHENPAGWPAQVIPIIARALTCQFATLTHTGRPVTWPLTPYVNDDRRSIDVSTGLVYPAKAERARRNPDVALLFSDAVGLTLEAPPTVLVLGRAAVRDSDLQANTDRYVKRSFNKLPAAMRQAPWFVMRAQTWYWARIWIEVTPLRIIWWQKGRLADEPRTWNALDDIEPKLSDPAPPGSSPGAWQSIDGSDWRGHASRAIGRIGNPTLTFAAGGWPIPVPVTNLRAAPDGFVGRIPGRLPFIPGSPGGPACLSFQTHAEKFVGHDNAAFVGQVDTDGDQIHFVVERRLGDFVLPGGLLRRTGNFLRYGRRLGSRLEAECRRRSQPVPRVRHPNVT